MHANLIGKTTNACAEHVLRSLGIKKMWFSNCVSGKTAVCGDPFYCCVVTAGPKQEFEERKVLAGTNIIYVALEIRAWAAPDIIQ